MYPIAGIILLRGHKLLYGMEGGLRSNWNPDDIKDYK